MVMCCERSMRIPRNFNIRSLEIFVAVVRCKDMKTTAEKIGISQSTVTQCIANLETSTNVLRVWDIFKLLRGKKTKLVLYVYDSFLLDYDETETELLEQIQEVFKKRQLQIKIKTGKDYNFATTNYA